MSRAIIDINRIKSWNFDRKIKKLIKKANKLRELTKHKYMILMLKGKPHIYRKSELKQLIKLRVFKKGTTIQSLEKNALYITTT